MIAATLILVMLVAVVAMGLTAGRRRPPMVDRESASTSAVGPTAHRRPPDRAVARHHQPRDVDPQLGIQLDRWVAAGLLTPLEADEIAAHERRTHPAPAGPVTAGRPPATVSTRRIPVVAEALGPRSRVHLGQIAEFLGPVTVVDTVKSRQVAGSLGSGN